jgi:3-oxoacyl-[acyl-carrier protein] reductase
MSSQAPTMPLALVTGVGRSRGIGAAIASSLAGAGWSVATTGWRRYDDRMPWGADVSQLAQFEADMSDPGAPDALLAEVTSKLGSVRALIMCHCESVDSSIHDTTVESWDRHFAVNARSVWLLIKAFAAQFTEPADAVNGRIVAITSDHVAHNLPYGASKGALDRIVLASAVELADRGITANVINPGANDTGWMSADIEASVRANNLQPRVGLPTDTAALVRFLCSSDGAWINQQLLYSDGGLRSRG